MYAWEAIEQSLTFIEEHLTEEIYTEELANIAGLSPFYFQRLFKHESFLSPPGLPYKSS